MKLKVFTTALVIISILVFALGAIPVSASGEEPKDFSCLGKGKTEFVLDEIVVRFKQDTQPFRIIKIPEGKVKEEIEEYSHRPDVVYAEPNYYAHAFLIPNDSMYRYQWNFGNLTTGGIGMEQAWSLSTGNGVVVAIVDTGIAYENYSNYVKAPDLADTSFVLGYDFVNNDNHPNDDNSHGTHVAGTVAQSTNNGLGVAGIAFGASLMPVKVLDKNGSGTYTNIANGIRYAADHGAKVINMSLGGPVPSPTLESALAYAYNKGVTIIAAAGNDGTSAISYPAAYDTYVIAVGATRYDKSLAYYSNYGASLDLVAPGGDLTVDQNGDSYGDGILQNTFSPNTKNTKDFGYWFFQGTSMASPHVAGVAALLIARENAVTPDAVRSALQETAQDLGALGRDNTYGYGLVNAYAALKWTATPNEPPAANDQSVTTNEDTPVVITLTASDPEGQPLTYSIVAGPSHGTLSGSAPNVIYTPDINYNGSDNFTFKANDGKTNSNVATVSITITPINDPPVANAGPDKNAVVSQVVTFSGSGSYDVDGTIVTYSWDFGDGSTGETGVSVSHAYAVADVYTVILMVTDNGGSIGTDIAIVTVTAAPQNMMHVTSILMGFKITRLNTAATARVTVVNESGSPVSGATVYGHWSGATTDTDSGVTNSSGQVTLQSNYLKKAQSGTTFTFTVDNVVLSGSSYDPTANAETSDTIIVP